MRMILYPLASGSTGNAVYVSLGGVRILVDAGVSAAKIKKKLAGIGVDAAGLDAVFITHEHADHIRGLSVLSRRCGAAIYANGGTWQGILAKNGDIPEEKRRVFTTGEDFFIGPVCVRPFAIPHDAADPVGYTFTCGQGRLGVATDLGHIADGWLSELSGCQGLVLEANHDVEMVRGGPYPAYLKHRILSRKGHLCNEDCGRALSHLALTGTQGAYLAHLSQENNLPELALSAVSRALESAGCIPGEDIWLGLAGPDGAQELLAMDV